MGSTTGCCSTRGARNAGRFGDWLLVAPPLVIDEAGCDELLAGLAASLDDAEPELLGRRFDQ
jgi:4-aminobutyrate aminotransferase-like enzyme